MDVQQPPRSTTIPHNLPRQLTPFVGREVEMAEIGRMLGDPVCWLLTLVGPGGIGKTRLAIQAATVELAGQDQVPTVGAPPKGGMAPKGGKVFADGVFLVDLQPVLSAGLIASTVADALRFPLSGHQEPHLQVFNYLADKQLLLLLDGFEHLLDGAGLLADLLQAAPGVKLLVTSREALNLQGEWLYPLGGLPFPSGDPGREPIFYDAVRLFVERAQRVRPAFSLAGEEEGAVRICQLVEGMPLALELAASWAKTLNSATIAAEIQRGQDFLSTSLRNVPQRHRSLQAVFHQTWNRLPEQAQAVLQRLSVFRGGFRRQAAEQVAGATLPILSALVDKSILHWQPDGRYRMHGLLRQYTADQLAGSAGAVERTRDEHCAYYGGFLHNRLGNLMGGRQRDAMLEIEPDLENIRAAWQWAVDGAKVAELQKSVQALSLFYQFQSRYLEAAQAMDAAIESVTREVTDQQTDLLLTALLVEQAWFSIRFGQLEKAEAALEECQKVYHRLDIPPIPGQGTDPLLPLGIIASIRGDYEQAVHLGEQARQASESQNHAWNRQFAHYLLASADLARGRYETARNHARQACDAATETKDRWFMAYCLNERGNIAYALGDYTAAKVHFDASYTIRQEFNDPEGMAVALSHLGDISFQQADHAEAQRQYRQSLTIYQEIDDRGGLARARSGLANVAVAQGDYPAARQQFIQALQIANEIEFVPLVLSLLVGIGEFLLQVGQAQRGLEFLDLAARHPSSEEGTRERGQQALQSYLAGPPGQEPAPTFRGREMDDLESVVQIVLVELAALETRIEAMPPQSDPEVPTSPQPLVEPLTTRELEVLHLIAEGSTNQQIADELVISVGTAKWYASQIYGKLGVGNRTQAVARAREIGMLS